MFKKHFFASLMGIVLMLGASQSQAACTACPTIVAAASTVASAISSMASATVVPAITLSTMQVSSELEKLAMTTTKTEEAVLQYQNEKDLVERAVKLKYETFAKAPNVCNTVNSNRQLAEANQESVDDAVASTRKMVTDSMNTSGTVSSASRILTDVNKLQAKGIDPYAANFFAPAKSNGKSGLTYTPDQKEAANLFVQMVTDPFPTPKLPSAWENTAQGQQYKANQIVEQSQLSVAKFSLNQAVASKAEQEGKGTQICGVYSQMLTASSDTAEAAAAASKMPPCALNPNASLAEVMEFMNEVRMHPSWGAMITAATPAGVQKEQAMMGAFDLWMGYKKYQQLERIEALLAAQLSVDARKAAQENIARNRINAAKAAAQ